MGRGKGRVGSLPVWMASRVREALRQGRPRAMVARTNQRARKPWSCLPGGP